MRRLDLLTIERERRASLHDDIQLLVGVGARAELVVLADDVFAGFCLEACARSEGPYVERAAEADVHPVVVAFAGLLGE